MIDCFGLLFVTIFIYAYAHAPACAHVYQCRFQCLCVSFYVRLWQCLCCSPKWCVLLSVGVQQLSRCLEPLPNKLELLFCNLQTVTISTSENLQI